MTYDDGTIFIFVRKEGAVAKSKWLDGGETWSSAKNSSGGNRVVFVGDSAMSYSDGGDGGDLINFADGLDIGKGKVAFLERIGGSKLFDDGSNRIFSGARAHDNKVGTKILDFGGDEIGDATGKREN